MSIAAALITAYFTYTYAQDIRLVVGVFLIIVIMDSMLDIPLFYLEKIAAQTQALD